MNAQGDLGKMFKVKGVVTDADGFPIHKADVFIDSLKTGFRTNKKGVFKLRIPAETAVISVLTEEYGLYSMAYTRQEEIDFTFPGNSTIISQQELAELGYIFDVEVFRNIGKKSYEEYQDIFQIIREKFTGVTVSSSNSITVRGFIGGDQTPLFIVDGSYVPSIGNINPVDLKSIELLKGEDTALYGARGAPGVFIITTK